MSEGELMVKHIKLKNALISLLFWNVLIADIIIVGGYIVG